jgi:hypothetical protein
MRYRSSGGSSRMRRSMVSSVLKKVQGLDGDSLALARFDAIGLERIGEVTMRMRHAQHTDELW